MLNEIICPQCGKRFIPAAQHIYRDRGRTFCSWTCYNHRKDSQGSTAKEVEQYTVAGELIETFSNPAEAAEEINGTADGIRTACRKNSFYKGYVWRYKK